MTDDAALAGHLNLIDYSRVMTRWGTRGSCRQERGALLYAGGSWIPVGGNGAFGVLDGAVAAGDLVARADAFFGDLRRGYSIKVRDTGQDADLQAACQAAGLEDFGDPVPQMACPGPISETELPEGLELRRVEGVPGVADFVAVNTEAYATYGMPPDVLSDTFDRPEAVVADHDVTIVVAYLARRPVATALTYVNGETACLQWVGTVSDARHMRLGRVVTERATNVAFEKGALRCTLQASAMGAPLYATLGYETQYHYREFVRWRAPHA